ncbi:helix-turn-helix domain-containing protein [Cytobacillus sp. FSL H8-0458]|uniref:helix-turn-helix domain-containing protein n=1 Tax=Cytobacillus sp. FSL H8-0458 TaxID=2975346 RepID=UPI0030FA0BC7
MTRIGEFLRKLRGKRSLRDIQKLSGVSYTYLRSIEKGVDPRSGNEIIPTPDTLKKLSKAYNHPYNELMLLAGYWDDDDFLEPIQLDEAINYYIFKILSNDSQEIRDDFFESLIKLLANFGVEPTLEISNSQSKEDQAKVISQFISNVPNLRFKSMVLSELKRVATKFQIWSPLPEKITNNELASFDLDQVINADNVFYKGQILSSQQINLLKAYLDALITN